MIPLLLIVIAIVSYLLGGLNGAIIISKFVFHQDIRRMGSGNAGFTNFVRHFGLGWGAAVVAIDILKSVAAVLLGAVLLSIPGDGYPVVGKLFAGFCLCMGHMYPAIYKLHGGKGVVCFITTLWLTDWRVGLVASVIFLGVLVFTQYVSLSSLCACMSGCLLCWIFVDASQLKGLAGLLALITGLIILWRHRANVIRIAEKKEPKIRWGKQADKKIRDDRF